MAQQVIGLYQGGEGHGDLVIEDLCMREGWMRMRDHWRSRILFGTIVDRYVPHYRSHQTRMDKGDKKMTKYPIGRLLLTTNGQEVHKAATCSIGDRRVLYWNWAR